MAERCPVCGLPRDLCICGEITKEQQIVRIRTERRRWGKEVTLIEGLNPSGLDLKKFITDLKTKLACGGSFKDGVIILQGNHKSRVKKLLVEWGIPEDSIELE